MALGDKLEKSVFNIIEKLGKSVRFLVVTKTYSPTTGETVESNKRYEYRKVSPPSPYDARLVDGANIQREDFSVILPSKGLLFDVRLAQEIEFLEKDFNNKKSRIISSRSIDAGDKIVAFELQLRG